MGHLDGSLVLPGLTHGAVFLWRVNRAGKPKMPTLKCLAVGTIPLDMAPHIPCMWPPTPTPRLNWLCHTAFSGQGAKSPKVEAARPLRA